MSPPSLSEFLNAGREGWLEEHNCDTSGARTGTTGRRHIGATDSCRVLLQVNGNWRCEARPSRRVPARPGLPAGAPRGRGIHLSRTARFRRTWRLAISAGEKCVPDRVAELARDDPRPAGGKWSCLPGPRRRGGRCRAFGSSPRLSVSGSRTHRTPVWPTPSGSISAGQAVAESASLSRISPANRPEGARLRRWLVLLLGDAQLPASGGLWPAGQPSEARRSALRSGPLVPAARCTPGLGRGSRRPVSYVQIVV